MTTIAYDGHTLAADSQLTVATTKYSTPKLYRLPDGSIMGAAGDSKQITRAVSYLSGDLERRPKVDEFLAIRVMPDKRVLLYCNALDPDEVTSPMIAIGSGGDFALGAMHSGMNAYRAIEIACRLDAGSGGPVQTMELPTYAPPSDLTPTDAAA